MKRKQPDIRRGGYQPAPLKPLTPETQRRKARRLAAHQLYLWQLLMSEAER